MFRLTPLVFGHHTRTLNSVGIRWMFVILLDSSGLTWLRSGMELNGNVSHFLTVIDINSAFTNFTYAIVVDSRRGSSDHGEAGFLAFYFLPSLIKIFIIKIILIVRQMCGPFLMTTL